MDAGYDQSIGIFACHSYEEALNWLRYEMPVAYVICGALVNLMLLDGYQTSGVDRLSELPILKDVPVISWVGVELGQTVTDRIRVSTTRVWEKPSNWLAWSDFIRRFHKFLDRRSKSSNTNLTNV